jgi:transposase
MKELTLNQREQTRLEILNRVLEGLISVTEAGQLMGVSERQAWRLLAEYRRAGAAGLAHGNRGQRPMNAVPPGVRNQVITLARTRYSNVNHTQFTELLAEREGLYLTRTTVRNILLAAGLSSPRRRRPPRHRQRRERKPQEGMLLQLDGSPHDWLEGRGPKFTLLLAVDDATGTVAGALFHPAEDTLGYLHLFHQIVQAQGIPLAVYTDRHSVFQNPGAQWGPQRPGAKETPTQFGRALRELGVTQIFALSPEAKGRVERANGTFQDRLVSELRLAGADTMAEANLVLAQFLPRYNTRFRVAPVQAGSAYRTPDPGLDLASILCLKNRRTVAKDNTVSYQQSTLQLFPTPERPSYAGTMVEIQERLDGQLVVCYQGQVIPSRTAPRHARLLRGHGVLGLKHGPKAAPIVIRKPDEASLDGAADHGLEVEALLSQVDAARLAWHSQSIKQGMERARQRGRRIGRPPTRDRHWLRPDFIDAEQRIREGTLSPGRAAKELGIGYATLKRLLAERGSPVPGKSVPAGVKGKPSGERAVGMRGAIPLTPESEN